jgi:hypothetical protein
MPYFKNNRINTLFIHIPKTGGSSIEKYFNSNYQIKLNNDSLFGVLDIDIKNANKLDIYSTLQHITYSIILKYQDFFKINWKNIQIISAVRNPYERTVSDLFYLKHIKCEDTKETVCLKIKQYLNMQNSEIDNHNLPQYKFITNNANELIPGILLLRTESLTTDMQKLGYNNFNETVNKNQNKEINYYNYLNNESIHLINEFYAEDFKRFNYLKLSPTHVKPVYRPVKQLKLRSKKVDKRWKLFI